MKGCPLHCEWCSNPEGLTYEKTLMYIAQKCYGCGKCVSVCKNGAIVVHDGMIEWKRDKCLNCLNCTEACNIVHARKVCGEDYTVSGLMEKILKDRSYFRDDGGLTVGGGEPMSQARFVRELMETAHKKGINTALESSSYASEENARMLYEVSDHIFTDIKHMNDKVHRKLTGVSNGPILRNIQMAAEIINYEKQHLVIRIPIIPGKNDSEENMRLTAEFIKKLKVVERLEILPYHNLGEIKYTRIPDLGEYPMTGVKMLTKMDLVPLQGIIQEYGISCNIGGK